MAADPDIGTTCMTLPFLTTWTIEPAAAPLTVARKSTGAAEWIVSPMIASGAPEPRIRPVRFRSGAPGRPTLT